MFKDISIQEFYYVVIIGEGDFNTVDKGVKIDFVLF